MKPIVTFVDVALRLFAFGLFVRALLSWVTLPSARKVERYLDRLYKPMLDATRKVFKPMPLNTVPPSAVDIAPLVLLCLIWWFVHPFAMWLLQ